MSDPAKPALSVEQEALETAFTDFRLSSLPTRHRLRMVWQASRRQTLEEVIGMLREDKTGKQVTYAGEFALRRFADDLEAELKKGTP